MANNKPPIILTIRNPEAKPNATTDVQFSMGDLGAIVEFAKAGKTIASGLREANKVLQTVVNLIKKFLSIFTAATNFIQTLLKIGKNIVEDALAIGGHVIIIHPWNQRTKAYKSIINTKIESDNLKLSLSAKKYRGQGSGEIQIASRIDNWFDSVIQTVAESTTQPNVLNLGIPQLTVQGAISELIWACDNIKDPLRPKFTSRMYTCGIGFILNVTNPLDLTQLIEALKALFDFSEFDLIESKLKKRFERLDKQLKSVKKDFFSTLIEKNTNEYKKEWEALGIKVDIIEPIAFASVKNQQELDKAYENFKFGSKTSKEDYSPNMVFKAYDVQLVMDMIGKALITGDSGPRWFGLRLDMIPVIKDLKAALELVLDGGSYYVSFVNDCVVETLTIITKKIEFIMKNLETIASILDSLDKLRASFGAGGAYMFIIEPEVGGMEHLKGDFQTLSSLIPNSGVPGYSILVALIAGYPDYGSGNAYVQRLSDLFDKDKNNIKEAYGLRIFCEPNPTSSFAMTDTSKTVSFSVRTITNITFTYTYSYRMYAKNDIANAMNYTSGQKQSSDKIVLPVNKDMIYELEVRADSIIKTTGHPERDYDIVSYKFKILQKLDLAVSPDGASVEKVSSTYYLHVPVIVRVYNFKTEASIRYSTSITSTMDITDYEIKTDTDDIDYADLSFDAVYTITFVNSRPVPVTDTIYAKQNMLSEKQLFSVDQASLQRLIKIADQTRGPAIVSKIRPPAPTDVSTTAVFPPDPRTTESFCISSLVSKYLDKNKRIEIVVPAGVSKTIMFYDCQDSIDSIKFYMVYNESMYDATMADKATLRIPADSLDFYYSTATTTTPVSMELSNFIKGYYVVRMSVYWRPGSIRFQRAGGVVPQNVDIYIHVIDGITRCFAVD